jgi:hypothetical protein
MAPGDSILVRVYVNIAMQHNLLVPFPSVVHSASPKSTNAAQ